MIVGLNYRSLRKDRLSLFGTEMGDSLEISDAPWLNGWRARTVVNASPAMLPPPAHDSGSIRFATPLSCGSFIRYSMPVLTGAFDVPFFRSFSAVVIRFAFVHFGCLREGWVRLALVKATSFRPIRSAIRSRIGSK